MLFSQQSADEQQAVPCLCVPYLTKSSFINSSVDRVTWSPLLPPAALNPDLSNGPYNQRTNFGFQPFANDSCSGLTFLQLLPSRISSLFSLRKDLMSFSHLRRGRNRPAESTFIFSELEQQVVDKGAVVTFLVRGCNSTSAGRDQRCWVAERRERSTPYCFCWKIRKREILEGLLQYF